MDLYSLLPIELQQSIRDLRATGVPEDTLRAMAERLLDAMAAKVNKVQMDVVAIEDRWTSQVNQIGMTLQADLHTQLGVTNGMLADLLMRQGEAAQGIADIKKYWADSADWRGHVDATLAAFMELRDTSFTERAEMRATMDELKDRMREIEAHLGITRAAGV